MIKLAAFFAVGSVALLGTTAPASASEIHLTTSGKSIAQLEAQISTAARTVCKRDVEDALISRFDYASCYKASVADARVELQKYAAAEGLQFASR